MRKSLVVLMFVLLFLSLISYYPLSYSQDSNLKVHVSVIETHSDGNYSEYNAFNAHVTIYSEENENLTWTGRTDENGWVQFLVNVTGSYMIDILFGNTTFHPHAFYLNKDYVTTLYEHVFKLAVFFSGDQITIFPNLWISLPGSVTISYPKSTLVNVTVDSYGLRWEAMKSERQCTITPLDYSTPVYDASGNLLLYPNYTVTIKFKTLEEGDLGLVIVDNATIRLRSEPLYHVPKDATIQIHYVMFVKETPYASLLNQLNKKLDFITTLLLQIKSLINDTVIPGINAIKDTLASLKSAIIDKIETTFGGYNMSMIWGKLTNIDTEIRRIRDNLFGFTGNYMTTTEDIVNKGLQNYTFQNYLTAGIVIVGAIVVLVVSYSKREKNKEKGALVITK